MLFPGAVPTPHLRPESHPSFARTRVTPHEAMARTTASSRAAAAAARRPGLLRQTSAAGSHPDPDALHDLMLSMSIGAGPTAANPPSFMGARRAYGRRRALFFA